MKPMLAANFDITKVKYPIGAQPKIDGVRGLSTGGKFTGRSLKRFPNKHVNNVFGIPEYSDLDGELAAAEETHADLCRLTTSALSRIEGTPSLDWFVFDLLNSETINLPYVERYEKLCQHVKYLHTHCLAPRIWVVPMTICHNEEELIAVEEITLQQGYEGVILRDLNGLHKQGRSSPKHGGLLRIKRFIDFEATVVSITEGLINGNEATINELGNTSRSTHMENMTKSGLVGSLECASIADVLDPIDKTKVLIHAGDIVTVAPGRMTHEMRKYYFENPLQLFGKAVKVQFFPKGIKDKPRFPTFQSIRIEEDMS